MDKSFPLNTSSLSDRPYPGKSKVITLNALVYFYNTGANILEDTELAWEIFYWMLNFSGLLLPV